MNMPVHAYFEEFFFLQNSSAVAPVHAQHPIVFVCMISSGVPMNASAVHQLSITSGEVATHMHRLKKSSLQLKTQQQQCDEAVEKLARSTAAAAAAAEAQQRHQTELEERVAAATAAVTASQQASPVYHIRNATHLPVSFKSLHLDKAGLNC